jgi:hypothetical protein
MLIYRENPLTVVEPDIEEEYEDINSGYDAILADEDGEDLEDEDDLEDEEDEEDEEDNEDNEDPDDDGEEDLDDEEFV